MTTAETIQNYDPALADESLTAQLLRRGFAWLRFPEPLERQYRDDHRAGTHNRVRINIIVAFFTSAGFFMMDHWIIKSVNATPDIIRLGLQLPILVLALLSTSRRFYLRWYEPMANLGLPLFGLGTVIMAANAPLAHVSLVGSRLLLVAFFCYFMLGMRMVPALVCNLLVVASLIAVGTVSSIPSDICTYLVYALICANIIGGVGAYALEHASRTAFLERLSLEEMAARDGLTRLLNRQAFEFRARSLWRTATTLHRPMSILMIDVDYFKRYNDQYGHQAGDECLRRVASAVREAVDPGHDELVARYGGEELIVSLIDRTPAEVEAVARNIVTLIAELKIPHSASVVCDYVSVSVGASAPTADASLGFNALANVADQALYAAKHQGRNRHVLLDPRQVVHDSLRADEGVTRPEARALLQTAQYSETAAG